MMVILSICSNLWQTAYCYACHVWLIRESVDRYSCQRADVSIFLIDCYFNQITDSIWICYSILYKSTVDIWNDVSPSRLWSPNRAGHYILHLWFLSFFLFSYLFSAVADLMSTMLPHIANLECRSERCCMRLAEDAGPKKSPQIRHLGTIAQLCRAISSQLKHVSTIRKKTC